MNTSDIALLPDRGNFTPVDPDVLPDERAQEERDRQADCPELLLFLKRTCDAIQKKDEELWERIINEQVRCIAYFDNRQYGVARGGIFQDAKWEAGDIRPIDNRYLVQVNKLMMEMMRSQPKIEVTATDPNDTLKVEAAKFAQHRINEARKRAWKASERQREAQSLLLKTITWRYIKFDTTSKDGPKERRPKKEMRQYGQTTSVRACKLCGHPMKAVEDQSLPYPHECINCGGNQAKEIQTSPKQQEVVTGYDEVNGGCVKLMHIDPMMVRIDLDARGSVADSQFLWYHQLVNRCILEEHYPQASIKAASGEPHVADRYKNSLQAAPSNSPDAGYIGNDSGERDSMGGNQLEKCPLDLIWLDPVMYRRVKFKTDQRLLGGRVLPAGTELGKLFADGMCVARNSDQILDVYGEDKNRKWLFCVYGIREHALHGQGTTNLLGPQDTRNEIKSYLIANLMYNAAPREFLRDGAITGNRLPALNEVAIVKVNAADKPVQGYGYEKVAGTSMPEQAVNLYESENGAMQEGAGTSSLSSEGAAADVKALGTATGVAAMRDQAVGRMGPNLMLITEMEEECAYLVLEHELENFPEERYMKMANQAVTAAETDGSVTFSMDGIRAFVKSNPRSDFNITAAPGSWMPRTETERKANFAAFAQFASVIADKFQQIPALAQRFIAAGAEAYDIDIEIGGWNPTALFAMARIRLFAKTVEIMAKHRVTEPSDENVAAVILYTPDAAINNEMDNHILFREFYKQWWASDEGRTAPALLRAVIGVQHFQHGQGMVAVKKQEAVDELAANEPREQKAAEIAASAAQGQQKGPSVSMSYKDVPDDIARQIEQSAGFQPSQMGQPPEGDGTGDKTNELITKAQTQIALQEHKADLDAKTLEHKTQLEIDKEAAVAQIDEDRAESDHHRAVELEHSKQSHQAGMEGAKLHHEATEKDKDRKAKEKETTNKSKK